MQCVINVCVLVQCVLSVCLCQTLVRVCINWMRCSVLLSVFRVAYISVIFIDLSVHTRVQTKFLCV